MTSTIEISERCQYGARRDAYTGSANRFQHNDAIDSARLPSQCAAFLVLSARSQKSVFPTLTLPEKPSLSTVSTSESKPITLTTFPGDRFAVTKPYLVFCSSSIAFR